MVKLIALYKKPENQENFENQYFNEHLPLAKKMPGLIKTEITRLTTLGAIENGYYLMTELYFNDMDSLNSAMNSPEGKAAGKNLMTFAKGLVDMVIGEIIEN